MATNDSDYKHPPEKRAYWRERYAAERAEQGENYTPRSSEPSPTRLSQPFSVRLPTIPVARFHAYKALSNDYSDMASISALVRSMLDTVGAILDKKLPNVFPPITQEQAAAYLNHVYNTTSFNNKGVPAPSPTSVCNLTAQAWTPNYTGGAKVECEAVEATDSRKPLPMPLERWVLDYIPPHWRDAILDRTLLHPAQHKEFNQECLPLITTEIERRRREASIPEARERTAVEQEHDRELERKRTIEKANVPCPYLVDYAPHELLSLEALTIVAEASPVIQTALDTNDQLTLRAASIVIPQLSEHLIGTQKGEEVITRTVEKWQEWRAMQDVLPEIPTFFTIPSTLTSQERN